MRLIIIRHGETIENTKKICQGHLNTKLSKKGIEQAKKLGLRFKEINIDAIYSSDLKRAIDTAKEIIKYHPELKLQSDKRIRERYMGALQGQTFPKKITKENLPKDFEKDEEIYLRTKEFIKEIYTKHKNKTVLIVAHGGSKKALLTIIQNKPISTFKTWERIKNTSVTEFHLKKDGKHHIKSLNCTQHLE